MAAETLSLEPCSRELNGLGQLVAWFAIRKGLYHRERHAQWISTLNGLCCILSGSMSVDTAQIFAVVSLLMKVHSEENAMDLKGIVHLLEKMVLFPELESHRRELQGFLEEAKCQAILQCCGGSSWNEEALVLWNEYFSSPHSSELGHTLHQLLRQRQRKGRASAREKFSAEHSLSTFKVELVHYLSTSTVLTNLGGFQLYNSIEEQFESNLGESELLAAFLKPQSHREDLNEEEDEEVMEKADEDDEQSSRGGSIAADSGGEMMEGEGEEEEEEGEEEKEGVGEQGAQKSGGEKVGYSSDQSIEGSEGKVGSSKHHQTKRARKTPLAEEIDWSSESSEVDTPPSHLPKFRDISIRNRSSLLPQTRKPAYRLESPPVHEDQTSLTWSYEETENLLKGVKRFGAGKWMQILAHYKFKHFRKAVSLKDKWRNLQGRPGK